VALASLRFAPEFQLQIAGQAVPAALRGSVSGVSWQTDLDAADRVELSLANEQLRWLDHPLLALDRELSLSIGYAGAALPRVFVGEIVSQSATFPSSGGPTLTVAAQDLRHRLQRGEKTRWFALPARCLGNWPLPDPAVISLVALERELIPIFDPVSAALSILLGSGDIAVMRSDADAMQKIIRKQAGESDYDLLRRISHENGWEMLIDHSGPMGGHQLRFLSLAEHRTPDVTLKYGRSLIDFTPRLTTVGQIAGISARFWLQEIKMDFTITVSWDWDRSSLNLSVSPGYGMPASDSSSDGSILLLEEPLTQLSAPRTILSKLLTRLNQRLTGSGSTIGDPRIRAGSVLQIEGVGERFGGLYRVTSATHTLDSGGYRTRFEVRKEIWFGSIPLAEQGAVRVRFGDQTLGGFST
jgi:hypothetical protein